LVAAEGAAFACLNEVDLFADLSATELREMDLMAPAKLVHRGELLYSQAQPVKALYDSYAEAIEDSLVCQLDVVDVEHFLLSDPRIAIRISRLLGERVAELEGRLSDLALRSLPARVASTLLGVAEWPSAARFGRARIIRLIHEQIAGLLGATREATSRILSEFSSRGLIRQGRGRITLTDPAKLQSIARGGR
jgi:CRP/FNR family transcriptional regulator, cyclic AMP receptor protein